MLLREANADFNFIRWFQHSNDCNDSVRQTRQRWLYCHLSLFFLPFWLYYHFLFSHIFIILFLSSSVRSLIHPVYYTLFILPYIGSGASPASPFYSASQHRARSTPYVRVYRTPHCSARVSLLGGVELGISQGQCPSPSMPSRVASAFIPTLMPGLGVTSEWTNSSLDFASLKGSCKLKSVLFIHTRFHKHPYASYLHKTNAQKKTTTSLKKEEKESLPENDFKHPLFTQVTA